jgi:hypothetical protein
VKARVLVLYQKGSKELDGWSFRRETLTIKSTAVVINNETIAHLTMKTRKPFEMRLILGRLYNEIEIN